VNPSWTVDQVDDGGRGCEPSLAITGREPAKRVENSTMPPVFWLSKKKPTVPPGVPVYRAVPLCHSTGDLAQVVRCPLPDVPGLGISLAWDKRDPAPPCRRNATRAEPDLLAGQGCGRFDPGTRSRPSRQPVYPQRVHDQPSVTGFRRSAGSCRPWVVVSTAAGSPCRAAFVFGYTAGCSSPAKQSTASGARAGPSKVCVNTTSGDREPAVVQRTGPSP